MCNVNTLESGKQILSNSCVSKPQHVSRQQAATACAITPDIHYLAWPYWPGGGISRGTPPSGTALAPITGPAAAAAAATCCLLMGHSRA